MLQTKIDNFNFFTLQDFASSRNILKQQAVITRLMEKKVSSKFVMLSKIFPYFWVIKQVFDYFSTIMESETGGCFDNCL